MTMKKSATGYIVGFLGLIVFWLMILHQCSAQAGFVDPYDSLFTIMDKQGGGQIVFSPAGMPFTVTDQVGTYRVMAQTPRFSNPKILEFKAQWQARKDTAKIASGASNKLWHVETKQARILVSQSSTSGTPTIEIKNGTVIVFKNTSMKLKDGYFYCYLSASLTVNRQINIYGIKPGSTFHVGNLIPGQSYVYNFATSSFTMGSIFK